MDKRIISLFDYSGNWPEFFARNGWDSYSLDIKHGNDILDIDSVETALDMFEDVHGILAAPPCTHFSNSGAQYWKAKDEDGRTQEAIELVYRVQALADLFKPTDEDYYQDMGLPFFWAIENPAGRLPKLIPGVGEAFYFDPCDYAGYLVDSPQVIAELDRIRAKDGEGVTREENQFIIDCNAYTKKTGLWGEFNRDIPKKRIEPVKGCKAGSPLMRLGGKSEETKAARSNTPRGFAKAFYEANKDYQAELYPEY